MRVRSFYQNDAHIYCAFDQAKEEFIRVMRLHARYYELFGIRDYFMSFSQPDLGRLDKYVNAPDKWLAAMAIIRQAMEETGYAYEERPGDAAFYGPKIDFVIESAVGNEYAISTNQLDFLATERFNLTYVGADGNPYPVYVIHRAPLGSHERFVAFLIEHYGGRFPTWLAPQQAVVIPISDRHAAYARKVRDLLFSAPVVTANWKAASGDKWTVPLGGGIGKIFHFGKLPVNTQVAAYYNVERPDDAARWQLRFQVQLMFPKSLL